ncbi:Card1-like endonuclease domain-containing protein [Rosettibacter firmus]|uniref:Card1-like endonuclease domain-containing protein n=1 Tax=Rosettibacter firmus TaxID=3111522 RepID=UPI00336BCF35
MNTIFCLVSRQSMANVLPILMFQPKQVVLFSTPEECRSADNLEKLFKSKNIIVQRKDGLNAYDFTEFKNVINNEINKFHDDVCLNVTGGTKLMALAAYEAFKEHNKKIIYCDTEHQNIIFLSPEYKIENLKADLTIKDYLLSYGYQIKESKNVNLVEKFFPLFEFILANNLIYEFVLLFKEIRERHVEDYPKITITSRSKNFIFSKNFDMYNIIFGIQNKRTISIQSYEYKSGDWLEYYVYYILKKHYKLNPLTGVKIVSDKNVENEIDVLVLKDYKLYSYSCKSGKSDNQYDLFQLETLRNITSGTFGKGIFVSSKKANRKFLERAKELSIKIINILDKQEQYI